MQKKNFTRKKATRPKKYGRGPLNQFKCRKQTDFRIFLQYFPLQQLSKGIDGAMNGFRTVFEEVTSDFCDGSTFVIN
jgi:hypothetical protein